MLAYSLGPADVMQNGKVLHEDGLWPVDGDWKKVRVSDMTDDGDSVIDDEFNRLIRADADRLLGHVNV